MHNRLTDAQMERLFCLSEELGEAQQQIGKILRFGCGSSMLALELGDIYAVIDMMEKAHDLNPGVIERGRVAKLEKLKKWTYHQE